MRDKVTVVAFAATLCGAPLAAQQQGVAGGVQCSSDEQLVEGLDISFSCNCTLAERGGERVWEFYSEPVVEAVRYDGPTRYLLAGDVIVAVNAHPITTAEAGRMFGRLEQGHPAHIQVRRNGRLKSLPLVPGPRCVSLDEPVVTRGAEAPRRPPAVLDTVPTTGYLGFGISARASASKQPGEPAVWQFYEPPTVSGVDEQSPAARAGLLPGDTITHIDGLPITSEEAGRRFGAIQPGETVAFGFRRGSTTGISTVVAARRFEDALGRVQALIWSHSEDEIRKAHSTFTGQLDNVVVEVTGPARVERIGDRIVVRTQDGDVTVVVYEAARSR